jgi:transposase-like protein
MTQSQFDATHVLELLQSEQGLDLTRYLLNQAMQALIDAEATAALGAAPYERSAERLGQRNGYRPRTLSTKAGDVELKIPKFRQGSFIPTLLEPRRRIDQALWAVVMDAYVKGVSTRQVDDLVQALGVESGISRSEVSRICQQLDAQVSAFRTRALDADAYPYVYLDATYLKARSGPVHQVVSRALVVAIGIRTDGRREVLGLDIGDSEDEVFWSEFLRALRQRGLGGVRLVISDAHSGLTRAIERCLQGASWQRCRVHFLRNLLAKVPKGQQDMVHAAIRMVFNQPTPEMVEQQWQQVVALLEKQLPAVTALMEEAREAVLAFRHFPTQHWRKIWSTNPLERVNKEIKRRTRVVGIFPNDAAAIRLVGTLLLELHEDWQLDERRCLSEASMALLNQMGHTEPAAFIAAPN